MMLERLWPPADLASCHQNHFRMALEAYVGQQPEWQSPFYGFRVDAGTNSYRSSTCQCARWEREGDPSGRIDGPPPYHLPPIPATSVKHHTDRACADLPWDL